MERPHLKFCRFCTHSKKLTMTPPAQPGQSKGSLAAQGRLQGYHARFVHSRSGGWAQRRCAPQEVYMSGRTGMSRSRRMRSASGVVGPFAASARN